MSKQKALPQVHLDLKLAPACPAGERIILRPFPPPEDAGTGLIIPDVAQERPYAGTIVAMGDGACDKAYDEDHRVGDEVWWSKYTGVIEEWHRIVKPGTVAGCKHDGVWEFVRTAGDRMQLRSCRSCHAEKLVEPIIVAMVDDILVNVSKQQRLERGEIRRLRGETAEGKTRYYIERAATPTDTLEIKE